MPCVELVRGFGTTIYTPFAPGEANGQCRGELQAANAAIAADYWDSRPSREAQLVQLLRTRFPRATVNDLTPILDQIRAVKSPREIALIRRASELAGRGLMEAMKSTRPGAFEYQLDAVARYVFLAGGTASRAIDPSPHPELIISGTCTIIATPRG